MKQVYPLIFALAVMPMTAAAQMSVAGKSRTMLAHWECHAYADLMDESDAFEKHFEFGLRDGKTFMAALEGEEISGDEIMSIVPYLVAANLSGPSVDFVLGRLYEVIQVYARDKVTRKAEVGPERLQHYYEPEILKLRASTRFQEANCDLLS